MIKASDNQNTFIIIDYPVCMFILLFCICTLMMFSTTKPDLYGVFLVVIATTFFLVLSKKKKFIIDKKKKLIKWSENSLFSNKEGGFNIVDIDQVRLSKGRGQFSHSGLLQIKVDSVWFNLSGKDICFGQTRRLESLRRKLVPYLNVDER